MKLIWSLLLALTLVRCSVVVTISQTGEFGVEQIPMEMGTHLVTFFVVARGGFDFEDSAYVLSFHEPTPEDSCSQSTTGFCDGVLNITEGWEQIILEHYPTESDGAALYIRRTVNLDDDTDCIWDHISKVRDEVTGLTTFSGNMYLSAQNTCDPEYDYSVVDSYSFNFQLDGVSGEITGLSYDLIYYTYTSRNTRIINSPTHGTIIEIETTITKILDTDNQLTTMEEKPPKFTGAWIATQSLSSALKLAGVSKCTEEVGPTCTQKLYLMLNSRLDIGALELVGSLELRGYVQSNGKFNSEVVLNTKFDVDTQVETGETIRTYDVFLTAAGRFLDTGNLYINDADNNTEMSTKTYNCVNIVRLDGTPLKIQSIIVYTHDSQDKGRMLMTVIYRPNRITRGIMTQASKSSAQFCFNNVRMSDEPHYLQVDYGDLVDIDIEYDQLNLNVSSDDVMSSGETMHLMRHGKRSLYNGNTVAPNHNEISEPQSLYWSCPYPYCWIHHTCVSCSGWSDDNLTTAFMVFLIVGAVVVTMVIVAALCCYPDYGWYGTYPGRTAKPTPTVEQ